MMRRTHFSLGLGLMALVLTVAAVIALALPVNAAPNGQDGGPNLPTPTPFPVENIAYELSTVGGVDEVLTFPGLEQDGITVSETTVHSEYPRGIVFSMEASSENGAIQDVILFMRYVHDSGTRVVAEFDPDSGKWVAHPWANGSEQPAWTHISFYWRVRDETGVMVETTPHDTDYWDPTRPWFRAESDHVVLYWFGFGEDDPDAIAQKMADSMAATHPRRVAGFGRPLSYKPIAVVYPSREALAETSGAGVERNRVAGYTSSDLGMSVQILRGTDIPPGNEECVWTTQPEDWTMERRINTIFSTTTHEVTHLYQYEVQGAPMGPEWWTEGQPEWFNIAPGKYDERLRYLATLQDIPTLQKNIGSDLTQADGCYALSYDVGPSFINFLLTNYGGIDTHLKISQAMRANSSVYEAVEDVTGKPFLDIENEWRVYLGLEPLTLADVDPASALEPFDDPMFAVGDVVTLPAVPALAPVYEKPGPVVLYSGQCFANMEVEILEIGALDGVPYFQVDCMGQIGWMTRDQLAGPN